MPGQTGLHGKVVREPAPEPLITGPRERQKADGFRAQGTAIENIG